MLVIALSACEKNTVKPDAQSMQANETELKIKDFLSKMKNASQLKSSELLPVEEALWNLEAAINYTRGDAGHEFAERQMDTLLISLNASEGMVNLSQLAQAYYSIQNHLGSQLNGQESKKLIASGIVPIETKSDALNLQIVTLTGTTGESESEPDNHPGWYWGMEFGLCDGTLEGETDAAIEIEKRLKNTIIFEAIVGARLYFINVETTPEINPL